MRRLAAVLAVAFVTAACTSGVLRPPAPEVAGAERSPVPEPDGDRSSSGSVRIALPDPVATWWQRDDEDLAAGDLAALWSLPLYRTDPLGREVPALAREATVLGEVDGRWGVEVSLAAGDWSDGRPVTAADVVATAAALAAARPAEWAAFEEADPVDDGTVRLWFDRPHANWSALLSRAPGVLPAHVLADGGLAAYEQDLPVTGGWFRLRDRTPGLAASFEAHADGPLGPPGLASVEALVVPGHDVSLGLLADGEVDLVLGHVVLDPEERRAAVEGVQGASVLGGTRFELVWPADGRSTLGIRQAAARRLDPLPLVEGLLRAQGRPPGGLLPTLEPIAPIGGAGDASGDVAVQVVRTVEGLALLGRLAQSELQAAGAEVALVRVDPPEHLAAPVPIDGRLRVVRVGPRRSQASVLASVGLDASAGVAADAAGPPTIDPVGPRVSPSGPHAEVAALLADDPRVVVLAEVAVTHVWAPERITGVEPSAWPGLAMWDAGSWTVP